MCFFWLVLRQLSYFVQDDLPRGDTTHSRLGPPASIISYPQASHISPSIKTHSDNSGCGRLTAGMNSESAQLRGACQCMSAL